MKKSHWLDPSRQEKRKREFEAALKLLGLTVGEFCQTADVSPSHLREVLLGRRASHPLDVKVHNTIARAFGSTVAAPYKPERNAPFRGRPRRT